jgi:hypothetical protein
VRGQRGPQVGNAGVCRQFNRHSLGAGRVSRPGEEPHIQLHEATSFRLVCRSLLSNSGMSP